MADRNGCFQICVKEDGVYLHIIPPVDRGMRIEVSEIADYLSFRGITFDSASINQAALSGKDEIIKLSEQKPFREQELMKLTVSSDGMTVIARFYPPYEGGAIMGKDEILSDLSYKNITTGIQTAVIDDFVKNREYCKNMVIALGTPVREGTDGRIEYLFETDLNQKPTVNEDGSVDFYHLNTICHCKKDQVLARMIPADSGDSGTNVFGENVKPKDVQKTRFQYGRNMHISENGLELISDIDGHVSYTDGKVFVSGVLEVTNVDVSTGNIQYEGNLLVAGNIMAGFSVKASGNIEVHGVVEGAFVEAGGQIIITRGVNGMAKGVLRAGSNVISKYIENATIHAGGYVETDSILHSTVTAKSQVIVQGKRGFITGGVVRAGELIEAKTLGTEMGVDTVLEVGIDPELKERFNSLQKEVMEIKKSLAMSEPVIRAVGARLTKGEKLAPDQLKQMQILSANMLKQKEQMRQNLVEMAQLESQFEQGSEACVRVTGEAFAGTRIVISESSIVLKNKYHFCRFIKENGEVVMAAM